MQSHVIRRWLNDLEFSPKIYIFTKIDHKSRKAWEVHNHSAAIAVQCDLQLHKIFAAKNIHNKRTSTLDGVLDEAHNEVDSKAVADIWGSEMDDIKLWTFLSSPMPPRNNVCESYLK